MMAALNKIAFLMAVVSVSADMYLQNPRGSNNRLNEGGRERANANRMFDSQNNNRGGYNVGNLFYYAGSKLPIQWTNQHSCADPNNNCEIVIQYMCGKKIRDGSTTRTIPEFSFQCVNQNCDNDVRYGMHENYTYYQHCKSRKRNRGLFTADQNLKGSSARFTRQNPAGTRRAYECPEERDYYPYWLPSPWRDIVVMTNNVSKCSYYKAESENVKSRWACDVPKGFLSCNPFKQIREVPDNKEECERITFPFGDPDGEKAVWREFESKGLPPPECIKSPWSRDNHQGNGIGGFMNTYNWTVPDIIEDSCVMRIRYNISTNDYDSWDTNSSSNIDIGKLVGLPEEAAKARGYTFKNDPIVKVSNSNSKLQFQLAINTAQFGRTFQDRSHVFAIEKRPESLKSANIYNVNVRGKRGNIVQVFPAVEYDFVPNRPVLENGDYAHIQWTGSNTNPRNNAGQGRAGTDRSNLILLKGPVYDEGKPKSNTYGHFGRSYPRKLNPGDSTSKKLAFLQPGSGPLLDDAGTYFNLAPVKLSTSGTFYYMCTRNNNFSNRSQKAKLVVKPKAEKKSADASSDATDANENASQDPSIPDIIDKFKNSPFSQNAANVASA